MNLEDHRRSCPGYLDEFGIWNNGFECPIISGQIRVCCGTESSRYCCSLENSFNKSELSTNKTIFSFIDKLNLTYLTLPIVLTCILIIILLLVFILLILFIYYYRKRNRIEENSRKQSLHVDHFPFSPPHHKVFFNEHNPHTTSTSSLSVHMPSDDWKELFTTIEQSMNIYPPITSQNNDHLYIHSNYLSYSKHQQEDIIV